MSSLFQRIGFVLVFLLSATVAIPPGRGEQGLPAPGTGVVRDFTLPERDKEGVLIWQLAGKHAKLRPDNKMEIDQLVLSTFRKTLVDWTLSTPTCILNRESREAISESPVLIVNNRTEITGTGFHWLANESRFIIRTNAKVVLPDGISKSVVAEGALPPAPAPANGMPSKPATTITSNLLNFDYEKRVATFEENVVAVDPQLTVKCKKMVVYFSDKNSEVVRIEGSGDVHLLHEGKEAVGEKSVFTRETGIVVLTEGTPRLMDEKGNWVKGSSIIYNTQTRIMKVEKPRLEFLPSSGGNMLDFQRSKLEAPGRFVICAGADVKGLFTPPTATNGASKKPSTIDAKFLNYDYERHMATFEGDVLVVDAQLTLKCKKMIVYFSDKSNEVIRVEGYGNVHILQQGKEAVSEKAVFTRESGILVLTEGNPKMKDEKGNWVKGAVIVYNTQTKMMHVENAKVEFKPSSGDKQQQ